MNLRQLFLDAYHWLCYSRKKHPPSSDIWHFRYLWKKQAEFIINEFERGEYRFDLQKRIYLLNGEIIDIWSSCDALVLKVLTWVIQERLKTVLLKVCYHLKGHGGLKGAVREVMKQYQEYKFFCKADIRSYYDTMDHYILFKKLHDHISDGKILNYVWQFLKRYVEWRGLYYDVKKGIPRGSSLSPLLGAFYLLGLDRSMEKLDVKYFRYMDDILILAHTRWKLKKAIRILNQTLNELKLEKHPGKTLIGRTCRGFDFLGYRFKPNGIGLAEKTIINFITKALRLYEQEPLHTKVKRLEEYTIRWTTWALAGLLNF